MRTRMGVVSAALLVLLSGCAMGSWVWSKPGITLAQGEKDMAECSEKANLLNIYGDKYDDGQFFVADAFDRLVVEIGKPDFVVFWERVGVYGEAVVL